MLEKFQVAISPQVNRNRSTDPLHVLLFYRVGFSWTADVVIFDSNKLAAAILDNIEWPYLRNGSRSTYIARFARSSLR